MRKYSIEESYGYGVIYLITFSNGKYYVGQSWNINDRWRKYKKVLSQVRGQPKLHRAFIKYGSQNCVYEIIDLCETQTEMDNKENWYMEEYDSMKNGYNCMSGRSCGKHSEETKQKMSKSRLGKYFNHRKGIPLCEEHKRNISNSLKGIPRLQTTKDKISISNLGKPKSSKHIEQIRIGSCRYTYRIITPQNDEVIVKNLRQYCKGNNLNISHMIGVANGKRKQHKGYKVKKIN